GGHPAAGGAARERPHRPGAVGRARRGLGRSLGVDRPARALMVSALTASPLAFALAFAALIAVVVRLVARRRLTTARAELRHTSSLHLATIEALARAIDAKDQTAEDHIKRLQAYAVGLARAVELPSADVEGIKTAALLHDIGKLAIPEHILSKHGPLTAEELQKVRRHSQVGAELPAKEPYPYP